MNPRHLPGPILLAILVAVLCGPLGCASVRKTLTPSWLTPADRRVADKLQRPTRVALTGQPLQQALEWLRLAAGRELRFHINWPALRDAGARPQTAIQLRIDRATVGQALRAVLQAASDDYTQQPVDYRIAGGMVLISTRADLYQSINVRDVYNIRDIIVSLSDYGDLPGYRIKDPDAIDPATRAGAMRRAAVDHVMQVIHDTVGSSEDWDYGTIHEINGDLIVVTTPENQRQIEDLLDDLRKSRKQGRRNLARERRKTWWGRLWPW